MVEIARNHLTMPEINWYANAVITNSFINSRNKVKGREISHIITNTTI